ncbi:MAG: hypothetical protein IPM47_20525 [Sphingobacteriales bacterium]|nr:MAG: hypothetical protein IPM47_20525 [Sphingobacteriales bacterium]
MSINEVQKFIYSNVRQELNWGNYWAFYKKRVGFWSDEWSASPSKIQTQRGEMIVTNTNRQRTLKG